MSKVLKLQGLKPLQCWKHLPYESGVEEGPRALQIVLMWSKHNETTFFFNKEASNTPTNKFVFLNIPMSSFLDGILESPGIPLQTPTSHLPSTLSGSPKQWSPSNHASEPSTHKTSLPPVTGFITLLLFPRFSSIFPQNNYFSTPLADFLTSFAPPGVSSSRCFAASSQRRSHPPRCPERLFRLTFCPKSPRGVRSCGRDSNVLLIVLLAIRDTT